MMANFSSALNLTRLDNKKNSLQNSLEFFLFLMSTILGAYHLDRCFLFALYYIRTSLRSYG